MIVMVVILSGCVTTQQFSGPNGKQAFLVTCNGTMRSMADCYNEASEICSGLYYVLDSSERDSGFYKVGYSVQQGVKRSLTFQCKENL